MKTVLLRLSGFTFFPLLSLVTPLLLLPVISSFVGASGISSVISGQAIGTFGATVLMWGWNIEGPVAIARAENARDRGAIYLTSLRTRLVLMVFVLPVACIITAWVAAPDFRFDAVSMAVASLLAGMSPAWFCIGMGQPKLLAFFDTIPRFLATVVSVPLLMVTHQLWNYTLVLAVATVAALVFFHRKLSLKGSWLPRNILQTFVDIREQGHTAGINVAANAYASTPTPIATATTPAVASGALATADTLYRFGIFTVVALGNAFQSWTIEPGVSQQRRRHLVAIWSHAVLGVVGAAFLTAFGPFASSLLFAGQIQATTELCFYYGVSFAFLSASTPFIRNILIPAGKKALVLRWTLVSAVLGVAFMLISGTNGNVVGVAMGMALSEVLLFLTLLIPALRFLNHESSSRDIG
ncbi:Membrane protein involved in the export of O-antigen and teichoic acid [Arthrobacter alpinus]|uniref:Membrane protein involved in the export of O-antigen and teichoic acid n=1 Tax=Arthrobacter alpinus TaxID=656366 RepID=A0A0U3P9Z0_9MICC|nr:polysaccharide biosynthesis protein [Arthrobacter alpinus]ALV45999.1 polysaccharide biosynthesis protein [Arthrobacter alpinus]SED88062.1 Membrane protein involved in the export of O-antigen and teichoic acid [Arthrobacter alpinus]